MENDWWVRLAGKMQRYADSNNTQSFFDIVKQAYGTINKSVTPAPSYDGVTLLKKNEVIAGRWA